MIKNKPKYIVIHCSDVSQSIVYDQLNTINNSHRERDFPISTLGKYVGYHVLVTGGKLYKCRTDSEIGAHCNNIVGGKSINQQSLGICIGFDGDIEIPNENHVKLMVDEIRSWQKEYSIPDSKVVFHRTFNTQKTCPGLLITRDWVAKRLSWPYIKDDGSIVENKPITVKLEVPTKEQQTAINNIFFILKNISQILSKIKK